jgi:CBS domain containing-hemolysin-like protein
MPADAFCAHFRLSVGLTHASTVAGIVIEVLGDLPEEGEAFDFGAVRVEITRTGGGRATEVNVRTLEGKTRSRGRRP